MIPMTTLPSPLTSGWPLAGAEAPADVSGAADEVELPHAASSSAGTATMAAVAMPNLFFMLSPDSVIVLAPRVATAWTWVCSGGWCSFATARAVPGRASRTFS